MARKNEKNQSRFIRRRKLLFCVVFVVCAYFVYAIVHTQIEIYKQKQQLEAVEQSIEQQQLENDELSRIADGDEQDYIERIAREKLGYAASDERVFVDTAGVEDEENTDGGSADAEQTP
ncbi:MAG: septum formation initiator family protein [Oscillospiraceae bacterium]|nr:septum formation initiator family protein [Oscillospiraceae bacterium]